ncbi:protein ACCELERATED CELL DEATH 6-like [Vitis riparia]|uniref:protein ACCELERATED CELL DEATH 6-like n=1 Tax=Vitis riparia TaxID=96939 RepID=UPI00155B04DB|nr:protein ACCELERATED CELL DEATH 6-like [Vitis riparia]
MPKLVNEQDSCGRSPLHYVAASGALALVDHLLQLKPSNGSFLDGNLATPAHMAAENGHLNVLKLFVKRCRYWIELLNNHHQNILHVAAQNGHLKVVRYIQNMFMVNDLLNETDEDRNTPLHLAAAKLHSSIVSTLVQTGNMDTSAINKKGETSLGVARKFQLVSPSNKRNECTNGNQAQATPNETGCARDEKIEAKKQRTIEILNAASARQAKKLEGILEQKDLIIESIRYKRRKEMVGTLIVMATLVATVTFTAAFTLPGGIQSEGPHQGMAVLTRKAAFKAFIVTDTVAMTTSMTAAVILFTSSLNDETNKWNLHFISLQLLWMSLASMGMAFLTGLFIVLSNSMELAIVQRTIEILKAASARQAKKLEGILEQEDLIIESIRDKRRKEMAGTLIVMATLVATVTFTAAFTLPGGIQSEGPHQGMAVLTRKAAFKAFIVTDTVAMTTSMTAAVVLFTSSWNDERNKWNLHFIALQLLWMSLASMGLAFLTGLFTVLSNSMELAIVVCFIGCLFPSFLYLLGPLILPEEFVWSLVDIIEKIKTKIHSFWILHN